MDQILPITRVQGIIQKMRQIFGKNAQLQQTSLRFEHVLTANNVAKKFNFTGNNQNNRPNEIFLGQNDAVVLYAQRIGVQKVNNAGGFTAAASGNSPVYTYPDKTIFNDAAVAPNVSEADALMAIWNGTTSLKTNTIELQNVQELSRFYRANQTQVTAATQAQLNALGFVDIDMPPIISGRDTTILDFVPAVGADLALIGGAANTTNVLVIQYEAIVARNAAQPATWNELVDIMRELAPGQLLV